MSQEAIPRPVRPWVTCEYDESEVMRYACGAELDVERSDEEGGEAEAMGHESEGVVVRAGEERRSHEELQQGMKED